jgi:hypothetical protein
VQLLKLKEQQQHKYVKSFSQTSPHLAEIYSS